MTDAGSISAVEPSDSRKTLVYGSMAGAIVVVDQITKYIVQQTLPLYQPLEVLGDFFRLTYI